MASEESDAARTSRALLESAKTTTSDLYALLSLPSPFPSTTGLSTPSEPPAELTPDILRRAWRQAAFAHHPDKNRGNETAAATLLDSARKAFDILSDPAAKTAYDDRIRAERAKKERSRAFEGKRKRMKEELEREEAQARGENLRTGRNTNTRFQPQDFGAASTSAAAAAAAAGPGAGYASASTSRYPPNKMRTNTANSTSEPGGSRYGGTSGTTFSGAFGAPMPTGDGEEGIKARVAWAVQDRNEELRRMRKEAMSSPEQAELERIAAMGSRAVMERKEAVRRRVRKGLACTSEMCEKPSRNNKVDLSSTAIPGAKASLGTLTDKGPRATYQARVLLRMREAGNTQQPSAMEDAVLSTGVASSRL